MKQLVLMLLVLALLLPFVAVQAQETAQPESQKTAEELAAEEIGKWILAVIVIAWLGIFFLLLLSGNYQAAFDWLLIGFRIALLVTMRSSSSSSSNSKSTGGGKSGGGGSSGSW